VATTFVNSTTVTAALPANDLIFCFGAGGGTGWIDVGIFSTDTFSNSVTLIVTP
jgi:hypothetical protein